MPHYWSLHDVSLQDVWLTIGSFDGVHKGHQAIVEQLTAGARIEGVPAVVLTFHPHPALVLRPHQEPHYLTSPDERAALLAKYGVNAVITHPFNRQVADLSAHEFMTNLNRHLGMRQLCVGHDFALGRGREGNLATLERFGIEFGYRLMVMEPVLLDGQVVSSSRVRSALTAGDIDESMRLLGRPYQVRGKVIQGDGRGRKLGIPTANLEIWEERVLPKAGVYACRASVGDQIWAAVTNVGVRPTFDTLNKPIVETHLLEFDSNLYDQYVSLEFIKRIRDEQRFPNVQALVDQIQKDIQHARFALEHRS